MWPDLAPILGSPWIYLVIIALVLCDVYLPVLPSGTTLILATVYAHTGHTSEIILLMIAAGASTLGDHLAFRAARAGGPRLRRLVARAPRLARADERFRAMVRNRTGRAVVFARFVPAGRCLVTVTAGSDPDLPLRRFQPWSAVAAMAWAGYTVGLGYLNALLFHTTWVSAVTAVGSLFVVGTLLARTRPAAEFG